MGYFAPGFDPPPLWVGGNGVRSHDPCVPEEGPARYECGTSNLPGFAGLEASLSVVLAADLVESWEASQVLRARWVERLRGIDGIEIVGEGTVGEGTGGEGTGVERTPIIPIRVVGSTPAEASATLERTAGIRTRAGLHCAPAAHAFLGTGESGALRLAPGLELTEREEDRVFEAIADLASR